MSRHARILDQLKRNTVALISLVVAVTGLTYNTWRNEQSEFNRNQREAAFELLLKLAELDEVVNLSQYDSGSMAADDLKKGWALVNTIDVLTSRLAEEVESLPNGFFGLDHSARPSFRGCLGHVLHVA